MSLSKIIFSILLISKSILVFGNKGVEEKMDSEIKMINYYDFEVKNKKLIEFENLILDSITPKDILDKYIKAIGGKKAVVAVKTISFSGYSKNIDSLSNKAKDFIDLAKMYGSNDSVPDKAKDSRRYKFVSKIQYKGKLMTRLSYGRLTLVNKIINQEKGRIALSDNDFVDIGEEAFKREKSLAMPFFELDLKDDKDITFIGIEKIDGKDAYGINKDMFTYYYDVITGLKVAEKRKSKHSFSDKIFYITTRYSDYREVKGVKIPFIVNLDYGFDLEICMSEVKINEGVTDKDFL
jgi:zinc protease